MCHTLITAIGLLVCRAAAVHLLGHHAGGPTESDWIRWTGVVVGLAGAMIVAPAGALVIIGEVVAACKRAWKTIIRWLARWLPWLRKPVTGQGSLVLPPLSAGGHGDGSAEVTVSGGTLEAQVERLREDLSRLQAVVRDNQRQARADHAALSARVEQVRAESRADHHALAARWEAEKRRDAQIDARGLPLIGLGIVLAGVPDGLARVSWIGGFFIAFSWALVIWLGVWPFSVWLAQKFRLLLGQGRPEGSAERDAAPAES